MLKFNTKVLNKNEKNKLDFNPKLKSSDLNLEILSVNKYSPGYLNKQIIILLNTLGIPDEVFLEILDEYLEEFNDKLKDISIFRYFISDFND